MPFKIIITAAKTVSLASTDVSGPPASINETISDTSIIVIDNASNTVPNGSPMRWAITSAWSTEESTLEINATPAISKKGGQCTNAPITKITQAASGQTIVHIGRLTVNFVIAFFIPLGSFLNSVAAFLQLLPSLYLKVVAANKELQAAALQIYFKPA